MFFFPERNERFWIELAGTVGMNPTKSQHQQPENLYSINQMNPTISKTNTQTETSHRQNFNPLSQELNTP